MNSELPIHLYKANAQLQLEVTRLLQESGHQWLEAIQQLSADSMQETTVGIQGLQQAADWQALATLPSDVFWRLCQGRMNDVQALGQVAARNQTLFADGLRQALASWQASVSEAVGISADTASFGKPWQPWTQPATGPAATSQGKTGK
jgi:ABC-type cobalamin transport system permease subunit